VAARVSSLLDALRSVHWYGEGTGLWRAFVDLGRPNDAKSCLHSHFRPSDLRKKGVFPTEISLNAEHSTRAQPGFPSHRPQARTERGVNARSREAAGSARYISTNRQTMASTRSTGAGKWMSPSTNRVLRGRAAVRAAAAVRLLIRATAPLETPSMYGGTALGTGLLGDQRTATRSSADRRGVATRARRFRRPGISHGARTNCRDPSATPGALINTSSCRGC
jgi:hypothetical protein